MHISFLIIDIIASGLLKDKENIYEMKINSYYILIMFSVCVYFSQINCTKPVYSR